MYATTERPKRLESMRILISFEKLILKSELFTILGKLFDIFQMNRLLKNTTCQNRNSEILLEKMSQFLQ